MKPVNPKGNQSLTPAFPDEASAEGVQVGRIDAFTAKVPNHGSSNQMVCTTPGGSSERLKPLRTLGALIYELHSPQQSWIPRKGHLSPAGGGWLRDPRGQHLPSGTGQDTAGIWGRELVTAVWGQKQTHSVQWTHTETLEQKPTASVHLRWDD